jgi:hypothetical protein
VARIELLNATAQVRCCNNCSKLPLPETQLLLEFHGSEPDVARAVQEFRRDREGRCSVPNQWQSGLESFVTAPSVKRSLLLARNRYVDAVAECPLLKDQRTWLGRGLKSENDPSEPSREVGIEFEMACIIRPGMSDFDTKSTSTGRHSEQDRVAGLD